MKTILSNILWGGVIMSKVWNANFKRKDYYDGQLFTY